MYDEIINSESYFDRIPDDVVYLILNRVHHAKSLCACLAVSTRFNSIAIRSTNLSLSVDRIHFDDDDEDDSDSDPDRSASKHSIFRSLFKLFIYRPLRFLSRFASSRGAIDSSSTGVAFYSPTQALKSFTNIEVLKIQLPSYGELQLDTSTNPLLKWKATFGSELKTCVIVAANSIDPNHDDAFEQPVSELEAETYGKSKEEHRRDRESEIPDTTTATASQPPPPFAISNDDLKTRVVWTISCLIAASSRHHLLKRVVLEHQMLKSIEIVDQHHQGTLTMNSSDISQMRVTLSNGDSSLSDEIDGERSRIPALKMKMWHAAELELPVCKKVMKGATLMVIGVDDDGVGEVDVEEVFDDVEEEEMVYGEAAREIRRKMKRSYSLEMESF